MSDLIRIAPAAGRLAAAAFASTGGPGEVLQVKPENLHFYPIVAMKFFMIEALGLDKAITSEQERVLFRTKGQVRNQFSADDIRVIAEFYSDSEYAPDMISAELKHKNGIRAIKSNPEFAALTKAQKEAIDKLIKFFDSPDFKTRFTGTELECYKSLLQKGWLPDASKKGLKIVISGLEGYQIITGLPRESVAKLERLAAGMKNGTFPPILTDLSVPRSGAIKGAMETLLAVLKDPCGRAKDSLFAREIPGFLGAFVRGTREALTPQRTELMINGVDPSVIRYLKMWMFRGDAVELKSSIAMKDEALKLIAASNNEDVPVEQRRKLIPTIVALRKRAEAALARHDAAKMGSDIPRYAFLWVICQTLQKEFDLPKNTPSNKDYLAGLYEKRTELESQLTSLNQYLASESVDQAFFDRFKGSFAGAFNRNETFLAHLLGGRLQIFNENNRPLKTGEEIADFISRSLGNNRWASLAKLPTDDKQTGRAKEAFALVLSALPIGERRYIMSGSVNLSFVGLSNMPYFCAFFGLGNPLVYAPLMGGVEALLGDKASADKTLTSMGQVAKEVGSGKSAAIDSGLGLAGQMMDSPYVRTTNFSSKASEMFRARSNGSEPITASDPLTEGRKITAAVVDTAIKKLAELKLEYDNPELREFRAEVDRLLGNQEVWTRLGDAKRYPMIMKALDALSQYLKSGQGRKIELLDPLHSEDVQINEPDEKKRNMIRFGLMCMSHFTLDYEPILGALYEKSGANPNDIKDRYGIMPESTARKYRLGGSGSSETIGVVFGGSDDPYVQDRPMGWLGRLRERADNFLDNGADVFTSANRGANRPGNYFQKVEEEAFMLRFEMPWLIMSGFANDAKYGLNALKYGVDGLFGDEYDKATEREKARLYWNQATTGTGKTLGQFTSFEFNFVAAMGLTAPIGLSWAYMVGRRGLHWGTAAGDWLTGKPLTPELLRGTGGMMETPIKLGFSFLDYLDRRWQRPGLTNEQVMRREGEIGREWRAGLFEGRFNPLRLVRGASNALDALHQRIQNIDLRYNDLLTSQPLLRIPRTGFRVATLGISGSVLEDWRFYRRVNGALNTYENALVSDLRPQLEARLRAAGVDPAEVPGRATRLAREIASRESRRVTEETIVIDGEEVSIRRSLRQGIFEGAQDLERTGPQQDMRTLDSAMRSTDGSKARRFVEARIEMFRNARARAQNYLMEWNRAGAGRAAELASGTELDTVIAAETSRPSVRETGGAVAGPEPLWSPPEFSEGALSLAADGSVVGETGMVPLEPPIVRRPTATPDDSGSFTNNLTREQILKLEGRGKPATSAEAGRAGKVLDRMVVESKLAPDVRAGIEVVSVPDEYWPEGESAAYRGNKLLVRSSLLQSGNETALAGRLPHEAGEIHVQQRTAADQATRHAAGEGLQRLETKPPAVVAAPANSTGTTPPTAEIVLNNPASAGESAVGTQAAPKGDTASAPKPAPEVRPIPPVAEPGLLAEAAVRPGGIRPVLSRAGAAIVAAAPELKRVAREAAIFTAIDVAANWIARREPPKILDVAESFGTGAVIMGTFRGVQLLTNGRWSGLSKIGGKILPAGFGALIGFGDGVKSEQMPEAELVYLAATVLKSSLLGPAGVIAALAGFTAGKYKIFLENMMATIDRLEAGSQNMDRQNREIGARLGMRGWLASGTNRIGYSRAQIAAMLGLSDNSANRANIDQAYALSRMGYNNPFGSQTTRVKGSVFFTPVIEDVYSDFQRIGSHWDERGNFIPSGNATNEIRFLDQQVPNWRYLLSNSRERDQFSRLLPNAFKSPLIKGYIEKLKSGKVFAINLCDLYLAAPQLIDQIPPSGFWDMWNKCGFGQSITSQETQRAKHAADRALSQMQTILNYSGSGAIDPNNFRTQTDNARQNFIAKTEEKIKNHADIRDKMAGEFYGKAENGFKDGIRWTLVHSWGEGILNKEGVAAKVVRTRVNNKWVLDFSTSTSKGLHAGDDGYSGLCSIVKSVLNICKWAGITEYMPSGNVYNDTLKAFSLLEKLLGVEAGKLQTIDFDLLCNTANPNSLVSRLTNSVEGKRREMDAQIGKLQAEIDKARAKN